MNVLTDLTSINNNTEVGLIPLCPLSKDDISHDERDQVKSPPNSINPNLQHDKSREERNLKRNPVMKKHRSFKCFQTLNQARAIWDPQLKPKGLFGAHLNIRSLIPKT